MIIALWLVGCLVRRALGIPQSIGDEVGYITCGALPDPHAPTLFLRVPFMAWLSILANRLTKNPDRTMRAASEIASALSVLVCTFSAKILGGPQVALVIGLLLTVMPGRIILARHVWPDQWLGLWLALACLVLIHPALAEDIRAMLLGFIAALAFLTRVDALLMAPFVALGTVPATVWQWAFILAPTVIAFAALSMINARRYRIPWPDNTWMFNVMIAAGEVSRVNTERVLVEREVARVLENWLPRSSRDRFSASLDGARQVLSRPVRAMGDLCLRLWASIGPDRFVTQRLLPPHGQAYPGASIRISHMLQWLLRIAFPLFFSSAILAVWVAGAPASRFLWPTLALAAGSLIHSRSRYRQGWLPGAALLLAAALSEPNFWTALMSEDSISAWFVSIGLAAALILLPVRSELDKES